MRRTFDEHISVANVLLKDAQYEEAINHFAQALKLAPHTAQKIDILNLMGRVNAELGASDEATRFFEQSIDLHDGLDEALAQKLLANKAVVLNNLATLYANKDLPKAIQAHKDALMILRDISDAEPEKYKEHLANTIYSLAGAYFLKPDYFQARKLYEEVIRLYEELEPVKPHLAQPLMAMSYFQLGAIASEQNKIPESRNFYFKAKIWYEKLMEKHPNEYRPYLASVLNNLGVVNRIGGQLSDAKKNFKQTIQEYKILADQNPDTFLPYYAASLNSLGNIFADSWTPEDDLFSDRGFLSGFGLLGIDQVTVATEEEKNITVKDVKEAESYYLKALEVYNHLADEHPETFTHYLATTLHNLGVLYDENKSFAQAEKYYKQALAIRQKLADKEPAAFDFDVCVTQMNLVTMYQTVMESKVDMTYKEPAEKLLADSIERLAKYEEKQMPPSIKNMLGDIEYFKAFFSDIEEVTLVLRDMDLKAAAIADDAVTVKDIEKRLERYEEIIDLYASAKEKFPNSKAVSERLSRTYTEMAWLALRAQSPALAQKNITKGLVFDTENPNLVTKEIYVRLLEGQPREAKEIYDRLIKNYDPVKFRIFVDRELNELGLKMDEK